MRKAVLFFIALSLTAVIIAAVGMLFVVERTEKKRSPEFITEIADFQKVGNLVPSETGWKIIYEEPGSPALTAPLLFSERSSCSGIGSSLCDASAFVPGMRVALEGKRTPEGLISVMKISLSP